MYALIENGQVVKYPYSVQAYRVQHPNVSLPQEPTEDQLAEVGVFPVMSSARPEVQVDQTVDSADPVNLDGVWTQQWVVRPATPAERAANEAALLAQYDQALAWLFDSTAQARRYDNRLTCAMRAGYAGPFQAEGQAFARWMDACNAQAYSLLAQVQAGEASAPASVQAFLATLPAMTWPD